MKRLAGAWVPRRRVRLGVGLFAGLVATALGGCANEQEPLIVTHAAAPMVETDPAGNEICEFEPDGLQLARGALDVSAGTPYLLAPVLQNNLQARGAANTNSSVEDSELQLTSSVDISLRVPSAVRDAMGPGLDGETLPMSYTIPIPTDSLEPGELMTFLINAIPAEYSVALGAAINPGEFIEASVELVFHATRTGNARGNVGVLDSRAYEFPITLCSGCMVDSCTCNGDACEAGTEIFATRCGNAQDINSTRFPCMGAGTTPPPVASTSGGDTSAESTGFPPAPDTTGGMDATTTGG